MIDLPPEHAVALQLDESQRQAVLMALAHLAVERPGWDVMLEEIAAKMDTRYTTKDRQIEALRAGSTSPIHVTPGQLVLYSRFKALRRLNVALATLRSDTGPGESVQASAHTHDASLYPAPLGCGEPRADAE